MAGAQVGERYDAHCPLPCQFKDSPRSEASTSPRSVVVVCSTGWLCDAVAVTSAVNDLLTRMHRDGMDVPGAVTANMITLR